MWGYWDLNELLMLLLHNLCASVVRECSANPAWWWGEYQLTNPWSSEHSCKRCFGKTPSESESQSATALKCFFPGFAMVKCLEKKTLWFCLAVTALKKAQNQQCLILWIPLEVNGSLLRMRMIKWHQDLTLFQGKERSVREGPQRICDLRYLSVYLERNHSVWKAGEDVLMCSTGALSG